MANKNWKTQLSKIKGYEQAAKESESTGFETIPDGRYEAQIVSADLGQSKNSGRLQFVVRMMIVNHDEFEEQKTADFLGLEGDSLVITLRKLRACGHEISGEDPAELAEIFEELGSSKATLKIQVKSGFAGIVGKSEDDPYIAKEEESETEEAESETEETEEETEDEETEETSSEISEGSNVSYTSKDGKVKNGVVIEVFEENNTARVESEGKVVRLNIDRLTLSSPVEAEEVEEEEEIIEEEEEIAEEPAPKAKKKPMAKKPVAKKEVKKVAKKK